MVSCGNLIRPENHGGGGFYADKELRGNAVRIGKEVAGMPDGHSEVAGEKVSVRHAAKRTPPRSPLLFIDRRSMEDLTTMQEHNHGRRT